jgi:transposase
LRNGNIKNFNVRYLKSTKPSLIMDIESSAIKSKSFMTSVLGKEIKNLENINYSNNNDCKLHYNKNKDIFTLLVPEEIENDINNDNKKEYISIDLGLRTLMNCKTNNYYIKIGDNVKREIERLIKREDNYKKIKNIKNKNKVLKRIRGKIKNKIDDLHWKTINYLTINYKNIIIGKWSTKSIISCEDSNLIKMNKRIIQSLSYYKLLERLKFKSLINKSNLIIQEEWYTSKTCTLCGKIKNNLGSNTVYSCDFCNLKTDRDYNGCRNIFLSCIKSIIS